VSIVSGVMINIVCFVWPIYRSYKALKYKDGKQQKRLLEYWAVFGI